MKKLLLSVFLESVISLSCVAQDDKEKDEKIELTKKAINDNNNFRKYMILWIVDSGAFGSYDEGVTTVAETIYYGLGGEKANPSLERMLESIDDVIIYYGRLNLGCDNASLDLIGSDNNPTKEVPVPAEEENK